MHCLYCSWYWRRWIIARAVCGQIVKFMSNFMLLIGALLDFAIVDIAILPHLFSTIAISTLGRRWTIKRLYFILVLATRLVNWGYCTQTCSGFVRILILTWYLVTRYLSAYLNLPKKLWEKINSTKTFTLFFWICVSWS